MNQARNPDSYRLHCGKAQCGGFTYLSLLIAVAVIGIAATATLQMGSVVHRRAAEEDLLRIGAEFQAALRSYANATPVGQPRSPHSLQDMLKDPRFAAPRRHLRKIYVDPITGKSQWGVIQAQEGGGIAGLHSLSSARPIKVGNFDTAFQGFENRQSYAEWVFMAEVQLAQPSAVPVPRDENAAGDDATKSR